MKYIVKTFVITLLFSMFSFISFAQLKNIERKSYLIKDIEIERFVRVIDIEGVIYENVLVNIKSISPDFVIHDYHRVKITIKDKNGKKIYKKTFNNTFLYISNIRDIEIGKKPFVQMIILPSFYTNDYFAIIREKEGI